MGQKTLQGFFEDTILSSINNLYTNPLSLITTILDLVTTNI